MRSRQREWLVDILESAPPLLFVALWQSTHDARLAGWTSAVLAALVVAGFLACRQRANPILLGINLHFIIITPLIAVAFRFGAPELGKTLVAYAHKIVLVMIFLVGVAVTLLSRNGFVGLEGLPPATSRGYSLILLAGALAAVAWAFMYAGGPGIGIGLPIMGLLGLRRLLIARWHDRNGPGSGIVVGGGSAFAAYGSGRETG